MVLSDGEASVWLAQPESTAASHPSLAPPPPARDGDELIDPIEAYVWDLHGFMVCLHIHS